MFFQFARSEVHSTTEFRINWSTQFFQIRTKELGDLKHSECFSRSFSPGLRWGRYYSVLWAYEWPVSAEDDATTSSSSSNRHPPGPSVLSSPPAHGRRDSEPGLFRHLCTCQMNVSLSAQSHSIPSPVLNESGIPIELQLRWVCLSVGCLLHPLSTRRQTPASQSAWDCRGSELYWSCFFGHLPPLNTDGDGNEDDNDNLMVALSIISGAWSGVSLSIRSHSVLSQRNIDTDRARVDLMASGIRDWNCLPGVEEEGNWGFLLWVCFLFLFLRRNRHRHLLLCFQFVGILLTTLKLYDYP